MKSTRATTIYRTLPTHVAKQEQVEGLLVIAHVLFTEFSSSWLFFR